MKKGDNISVDKQFLLNWIEETDNESLIHKVKNYISKLSQNSNQLEDIEIPEWQKEESLRRYKELQENPESGIDFFKVKEDLLKKYGL